MRKYLLIAREKIIGITNDEGLKALNGHLERVFEVPCANEIPCAKLGLKSSIL